MLLSLEFSREDELRGTELEAYWDEGCKLFVCSVFLLENADSQSMLLVSFGKYFLQTSFA